MADPPQNQSFSTFPNPPAFLWREFTSDNLARFADAKQTWEAQNSEAASSKAVTLIPGLPNDLSYLQPPPEPPTGSWKVFGGNWTLKDELPSLEESGVDRLAPASNNTTTAADPNRDRALNLKRLVKSVLLNFLEFVGVASIDPDGTSEKAADIETIFINIHHACNEYRPHQAKEKLIQTMQTRLDQIRNETAVVNAVTDKAKRVLEGLGSIAASGQEDRGLEGHGGVQNGVDGAPSVADEAWLWDESSAFE
ncbi:unnamed protein product [Discula destructiva]